MEGADQLLTIAEIGAAFAGFTGVIGALGRTPGAAVPAATRARFWLMIEFSIATIFFALIPFAVFNFTAPSEALVWTISSAVMAGFIVLHMTVGARWSTRGLAPGDWPRWEPRLATLFFAVVALNQALNALGVGFDRSYAAFFNGLLLFLLIATANFVALMAALWSNDDSG
jgi:hypothetical protein